MLFNTYQVRNKVEKSDNTKFFQRHVEPSYIVGGCYKLFNHFEKTTCHNLLVLEICTMTQQFYYLEKPWNTCTRKHKGLFTLTICNNKELEIN